MSTYAPDMDPADFTVDQVTDYLATAPGDDAAKVIAAEQTGKNRKGITEFTPSAGRVGASADGYTRVIVDAYPTQD